MVEAQQKYVERLKKLSPTEIYQLIEDTKNSESSRELDWVIERIIEVMLEKSELFSEEETEEGIEEYETKPKVFNLLRKEDVTGVSGTGIVAEGVQFTDGTCVIRWSGSTPTTTFYNSIKDVEKIHLHNGATKIV